jgi:hypothetical protein
MVTPKSVVETTPLVVARIRQLERAQRVRTRSSAPAPNAKIVRGLPLRVYGR